jgi:hypothetical protein
LVPVFSIRSIGCGSFYTSGRDRHVVVIEGLSKHRLCLQHVFQTPRIIVQGKCEGLITPTQVTRPPSLVRTVGGY